MCNPPFYESEVEMLTSAASKQRPPFTACTGSENEMVTPGGEVAFVSRMIEESFILRDRVQWYTSMLGKFSSVAVLMQKLRDKEVDNYAVTEFVQGSKTRRWAIAWSFDDLRPTMSVARGVSSLQKSLLPFPSEYFIAVSPHSFSLKYTYSQQYSQVAIRSKQGNVSMTFCLTCLCNGCGNRVSRRE
jgi:23S rRNA (adenine1618-N6)-methyltransferase